MPKGGGEKRPDLRLGRGDLHEKDKVDRGRDEKRQGDDLGQDAGMIESLGFFLFSRQIEARKVKDSPVSA